MEITCVKLGAEVRGLRLDDTQSVPETTRKKLKELVHEHRLIVIRNQGKLSGHNQVEVSQWFGELDGTVFPGDPLFMHPKCPHPSVHRISNDPVEGCTKAGRSGWHIDGSFVREPFLFTFLHIYEVPSKGATEFVGFRELLESIPAEMRARWDRLWMMSNKGNKEIQPLIYPHPVTGLPVMCIHLGMTEAFIWDKDTARERRTDEQETRKLLNEITQEIEKDGKRLVYAHEWKEGDFIITDNLAVGHLASYESERPRSEVGLRVLHRTSVKGPSKPNKLRVLREI